MPPGPLALPNPILSTRHADTGTPHTTALPDACREFESLFLGLLLRQMRATVSRSPLLPTGAAGDIFDFLWTREIARAGAHRSPLGIADALSAALSKHTLKLDSAAAENIADSADSAAASRSRLPTALRSGPPGAAGGGHSHEDHQ